MHWEDIKKNIEDLYLYGGNTVMKGSEYFVMRHLGSVTERTLVASRMLIEFWMHVLNVLGLEKRLLFQTIGQMSLAFPRMMNHWHAAFDKFRAYRCGIPWIVSEVQLMTPESMLPNTDSFREVVSEECMKKFITEELYKQLEYLQNMPQLNKTVKPYNKETLLEILISAYFNKLVFVFQF